MKFIKSPIMKKKLGGITEITTILDNLTPKQKTYFYHERVQMKFITKEYMTKWIKEQKLIEVLLNESSHGELIKRAGIVLKFLAENHEIDEGILNLLWKC